MATTLPFKPSTRKFSLKLFINLVRALFPRWNFFDQTGFAFELYFKSPQSLSWEYLSFTQDRKKSRLIFNPGVNESLAQFSVVEQFAHDIQSQEDIQHLTSYRLLCSVLKVKLNHEYPGFHSVQFKIIGRRVNEAIEIFVSDTLVLDSL